jgi:ComF family protein
MYNNCLKLLQAWLLPVTCLLCGVHTRRVSALCEGCEHSLPYLTLTCPICAAPVPYPAPCGRCQQRHPQFDRAVALMHYRHPVDRLIPNLKYHGHLHLARHLGELMLPRLLRRPAPPPDCLIPVPLHPTRLRQRGYNQALEIARPIAARLKIPLEVHAVRRIRATPAQALLPLRERARNVRGAFIARTRFDGRRVAIVDDVMTSGHTANSLAQCLRRAGAEDIEVWVVARA